MKAGAARRLLASLAVAWLLLACAPLAPAALADDPTPGPDTVNVDPGKEPLMPYIVALLVASGVLVVVGVVAVQVNRASGRRAGAGRGLALWTCPACGTTNAGDRETCYACGAARTRAPG